MENKNIKRFFLIDGIGALVSAFLLGVVLVHFQPLVGIPTQALYLLAFLPCLFAIYDFYCFFKVNKNSATFLKGIALANVVYCLLSLGLVFFHRQAVTFLGWGYVIVEVFIVLGLAILEINTASK